MNRFFRSRLVFYRLSGFNPEALRKSGRSALRADSARNIRVKTIVGNAGNKKRGWGQDHPRF